MAGLLRKSMLYLGLVDEEEPVEDYDAPPEEEYPPRSRAQRLAGEAALSRPVGAPGPARVVGETLRPARPAQADSPAYRITTVQPRTYNEARTVGEYFREGIPVIMNLTEMDDGDAKRLVDFAAGLIFGLRGSIERVTNKVFLLSPSNVTVSAEDKALIAEGGFFNQS